MGFEPVTSQTEAKWSGKKKPSVSGPRRERAEFICRIYKLIGLLIRSFTAAGLRSCDRATDQTGDVMKCDRDWRKLVVH